jgi:hypothetical protein
MGRAPPGAIHAMSRWTIRIFGILLLLMLFLVMGQMMKTLKMMQQEQEQSAPR